jgi:hypothetical protein
MKDVFLNFHGSILWGLDWLVWGVVMSKWCSSCSDNWLTTGWKT